LDSYISHISFLDQLLQTENFPQCKAIIENIIKGEFLACIESSLNDTKFNSNVVYARETLLRIDLRSYIANSIFEFLLLGKESHILMKLIDSIKPGIDDKITVNIFKLLSTLMSIKISVSPFLMGKKDNNNDVDDLEQSILSFEQNIKKTFVKTDTNMTEAIKININQLQMFWNQQTNFQLQNYENGFLLEDNIVASLDLFFTNTVEHNLFLTGLIMKTLISLIAFSKLDKHSDKEEYYKLITYSFLLNVISKTNDIVNSKENFVDIKSINEEEYIKVEMKTVGIMNDSAPQNYIILKEFSKELLSLCSYLSI